MATQNLTRTVQHSDAYAEINCYLDTAKGLASDLVGKGLEPGVGHLAHALYVLIEKAQQLTVTHEAEAMRQEREAA